MSKQIDELCKTVRELCAILALAAKANSSGVHDQAKRAIKRAENILTKSH